MRRRGRAPRECPPPSLLRRNQHIVAMDQAARALFELELVVSRDGNELADSSLCVAPPGPRPHRGGPSRGRLLVFLFAGTQLVLIFFRYLITFYEKL